MQRNIVSVAPMMDWTDRHCRYFHRLLAPHAVLYTEMVTTGALLHGDVERHLRYDASEHPVALQLGGSEPDDLAKCAKLGAAYGYDEINLNCGCPSERVQKGAFGACLMAEPQLVADCVAAMREAVSVPVTVKCRIGIDDADPREMLWRFVDTVKAPHFIVHARKAWLKGLSPRENREVPPLDYDLAAALKKDFPDTLMTLNGGITTAQDTLTHLKRFDGVMLGRAAYHTPEVLIEIEEKLHGTAPITLESVVSRMAVYAQAQMDAHGTPLHAITKHMVGMNTGKRGARRWRQILTVDALKSRNAADILNAALEAVA
ncbi:MAG: tRNA dihydrouridine(20/20a) synthase DusA [Alphaproteobacteria bacterium]|nr:tRNA dihydrouridine(20/20a) synthase DusA [Alphaproteobacteria bacterium]